MLEAFDTIAYPDMWTFVLTAKELHITSSFDIVAHLLRHHADEGCWPPHRLLSAPAFADCLELPKPPLSLML